MSKHFGIFNNTFKVWAIIPAGGSSQRFLTPTEPNGSPVDKLQALLQGQPVLYQTVKALHQADCFDGIVVAAHPDRLATYRAMLSSFSAVVRVVPGGASRRESVYCGLKALSENCQPESCQIVAVHDAARPLVHPAVVRQAVKHLAAGNEHTNSLRGVVVGTPITDTVKRLQAAYVDKTPYIGQTEDRQALWLAQTPQIFYHVDLLAAHQQVEADVSVTDDAQLLELAGIGPIAMLPYPEEYAAVANLKITHARDLLLAEALRQIYG